MRREEGVTLTGLLVASVFIIAVLLVGMKLVPVFLEYNTIQRHFRAMADDPALRDGQREQIRRAFVSRAMVDDIKAIGPEHIQVAREGKEVVISADYDVKVPLFGNFAACLDFHPSSKR